MPRRRRRAALALVCLLAVTGCAPPPPNLTPRAEAAWRGTQVIRALDVLRDGAVDLHDQVPAVLDEATTRQVVQWHRAAVEVVHSYPAGAVPMVRVGLAELLKVLPEAARQLLEPYVRLALAILGGG